MLPRFQGPRAIREQIASGMEYHLLFHGRTAQGYLAMQGDRGKRSLFLSKLYVRKPARGLGLARAALDLAEATCRRRGLRELWLTVNKRNASSIAWYEKMGFVKAGSVVQDIGGGFVMDDYRMKKRGPPADSPGQRQNRRRGACSTGRRATRAGRGPRRRGG